VSILDSPFFDIQPLSKKPTPKPPLFFFFFLFQGMGETPFSSPPPSPWPPKKLGIPPISPPQCTGIFLLFFVFFLFGLIPPPFKSLPLLPLERLASFFSLWKSLPRHSAWLPSLQVPPPFGNLRSAPPLNPFSWFYFPFFYSERGHGLWFSRRPSAFCRFFIISDRARCFHTPTLSDFLREGLLKNDGHPPQHVLSAPFLDLPGPRRTTLLFFFLRPNPLSYPGFPFSPLSLLVALFPLDLQSRVDCFPRFEGPPSLSPTHFFFFSFGKFLTLIRVLRDSLCVCICLTDASIESLLFFQNLPAPPSSLFSTLLMTPSFFFPRV